MVLRFLLLKKQISPAQKKAEHEKTTHCFADSRLVPYMTRDLMGLFLSLLWSPELNLLSCISEDLDLESGKEGIRYTSVGLSNLVII